MLYTSNTGEGTVSRIDLATGNTLAKVTVGGRPWNVRVSKENHRAYVTNEASGAVDVIGNDRVIATILVGLAPHGLVVNDEAGLVFAAATGSNQVAVINMESNAVSQTVPVGTGPTAIATDKRGRIIYVANQTGGTVSVLNVIEEDED